MPYTPKERKQNASQQKRDEHGHFIPSHPTPPHSPRLPNNAAPNLLSHLFKSEESHEDETLIDVKVTNPLHRITQILQEIKNHQSTTFSLRFTIPLIALPIFLLVAFQLGKAQTDCSEQVFSTIGVLREVSVELPKEDTSIFRFLPNIPYLPKSPDLLQQSHTILTTQQGETFTITHDQKLNLIPFVNRPVIVTGAISACTRTITLDSLQNISSL